MKLIVIWFAAWIIIHTIFEIMSEAPKMGRNQLFVQEADTMV